MFPDFVFSVCLLGGLVFVWLMAEWFCLFVCLLDVLVTFGLGLLVVWCFVVWVLYRLGLRVVDLVCLLWECFGFIVLAFVCVLFVFGFWRMMLRLCLDCFGVLVFGFVF